MQKSSKVVNVENRSQEEGGLLWICYKNILSEQVFGKSSNMNKVIKTVLNFLLLFFHDRILCAQKAQKEYKTPKVP